MTALAVLSPVANKLFANTVTNGAGQTFSKEELFERMVKANDRVVQQLLDVEKRGAFGRRVGYEFAALVSCYVAEGSEYHHKPAIIPALEKIVTQLLAVQAPDGTVSIGNLESPPDTAFLLEPLCAGAKILGEYNAPGSSEIQEKIKTFITNAAKALTAGGVHTPNHRWVISAALAQINELYPNKKYVARIDEWLSEGVFNDADGHYPERSITYSFVENRAFLTMGRLLNRPALFVPVRKNLQMSYYYMDPGGDLVTTDSRRQDQYMTRTIVSWYPLYRTLAIIDENPTFAAVAKYIESLPDFEKTVVDAALFQFLDTPLLQKEMPTPAVLPVNYEKLFTTSHLARIRKGDTTTTIFGGIDWPITIASGRSNSPNFFAYRKGQAQLKYLRLSSEFFSMGYFYSQGLKKQGNQYILHKKLQVPYYQPLPKNLRKASGDYTLSPSIDDRFWNKMAFDKRPVSNLKKLETTVTVSETGGRTELHFNVTGMQGVAVTIELCFREGGEISGVKTTEGQPKNYFLEKEEGKYEYKGDTIHFGPGVNAGKLPVNIEGERYSTHFGTLRTEGIHVYLTGTTPFEHKLYFY